MDTTKEFVVIRGELLDMLVQRYELKEIIDSQHNKDMGCAERVKEYLHTHISEKITMSKISCDLYISISSMQHEFVKKYNCSIMKYLRNIRIEYAKTLLVETGYSVTQIAQTLGFGDEKYFARCFKQNEGVSPRTYRNIHKKDNPM